ncbi:hypothetical protein F5B18DRAFT_625343 [Nemania serpens]|nr:hypothetical protein F5B18DRAFT_625343 [Nemania serpens]
MRVARATTFFAMSIGSGYCISARYASTFVLYNLTIVKYGITHNRLMISIQKVDFPSPPGHRPFQYECNLSLEYTYPQTHMIVKSSH